ncbi:SMC-Scp complex subunit ScpB [Alkalibacter saccharofermentans]|jgi:segregation and condensation protein B|uniref:Segregation and condensation protein B n=1 Tax=Alkalibacter saccharofermentans DSM 14828 TaxID=1120975 RepID=A0A1M4Z672_9FIRM|nr:SMC-Scp complex subunit ScpB [Alkalibacter saccharofermentans]SHF13485.1 segregation and condensation protein B [Alkalibacter saccharofermentans DSM 14828]
MNEKDKKSIIESILFAMGEPVSLGELSQALEEDSTSVKKTIQELMDEYKDAGRGVRIKQMNNRYQMCTDPQNYEFIHKLLYEKNKASLSQASLETLAIIAYKQPVTRVEIEALRGVKSSSSIQTLLDRNLIKEGGRLDAPGKPMLFETTVEFLKYSNITNIKELPSYDEFVNGIQEKIVEK